MISVPSNFERLCLFGRISFVVCILAGGNDSRAQETESEASLQRQLTSHVLPVLREFCFDCHSDDLIEAELDLSTLESLADARRQAEKLRKVAQVVESRQMPPQDSPEVPEKQLDAVVGWLNRFLTIEAQTRAGDPGPVVLRRLSHAEYTYSIRDLTGVPSLDPAKEFPVDGAAGEGFTNTGNALVMSPALVTKYLDASKAVANHMILLPDGIRFSKHASRRDWTDEQLGKIRRFYARYSDQRGGTAVNLQGIQFDTNQGGRLAVGTYLAALLETRDRLRSGEELISDLASARGIHVEYLRKLWSLLENHEKTEGSLLVNELQQRWARAEVEDLAGLVLWIEQWQSALWRFNAIGQIGREGGPPSWQEARTPLVAKQEFRVPLPKLQQEQPLRVVLQARGLESGDENGVVVWRNPRLEREGSPSVSLRDVVGLQRKIDRRRAEGLSRTSDYLRIANEVTPESDLQKMALDAGLELALLRQWLRLLDVTSGGPVQVTGHFVEKIESSGDYDFIKGWGTTATPSLIANSSDQQVRIPGIARPHSVFVHPSPTLFAAAGWQSPVSGVVKVEAEIQDAHPECGNGVEWWVLHRTFDGSRILKTARLDGAGQGSMESRAIAVKKGEVIALVVGPKDGSHACDLTRVDFRLAETGAEQRSWDLASDVSDDILSSNPQDDRYGHHAVWHFYRGEMSKLKEIEKGSAGVPAESVLAEWQQETNPDRKVDWGQKVQALVTGEMPQKSDSPDGLLYSTIHAFFSPVFDEALLADVDRDSRFGPRFGLSAGGADAVTRGRGILEFRLPGELASEAELVVSAEVAAPKGAVEQEAAAVQFQVLVDQDAAPELKPTLPVVVPVSTERDRQLRLAFDHFRQYFPVALCYTKIVPVDEVVTLRLFYREDEWLKRLMLDAEEVAEIDRMWDELYYISQEPLELTVAFEQLSEFATQDRPDIVVALEPLRQPILDRADQFKKRMQADEETQLHAVLDLAGQAWRQSVTESDRNRLQNLYEDLRVSELAHEDALRLMLARILTSPAFLYRLEVPPSGEQPSRVSDVELANRLSYFLWSSMPDRELMDLALKGRLQESEVLWKQAQRMMADRKSRRMAIHFACQWLGIRNFDQHDEKNEGLYPNFVSLRADMYEESIRFFEDMIRNNGTILDLLSADHVFVNDRLAQYYGLPPVDAGQWLRVEGVQNQGRGGVLGMASVLSKQSGASRTSPILRGNWIYETLLGQQLPRPPADVPQLPEGLPQGLSARQMIEAHSAMPACAKCHERIDPLGFALENFDAVGRLREQQVDTRSVLPDGNKVEGIAGLRDYLMTQRREEVVEQFNRKLLGYALGRSTQLSDQPLLDTISASLERSGYHWNDAMKLIVLSPQFREIRGRDAKAE